MSYILDALNKSEQERAKQRAPDLHSLSRTPENKGLGTKHFLAIVVVIVAVNVAALWYFLGDRLPMNTQSDEDPVTQVAQPVAIDPVINNSPVTATTGNRQRPVVDVTAHIYADDTDLRMVKIDGISRKEGDTIQPGLTLVEITESGVILNFEGDVYPLDIVEDWQLY